MLLSQLTDQSLQGTHLLTKPEHYLLVHSVLILQVGTVTVEPSFSAMRYMLSVRNVT